MKFQGIELRDYTENEILNEKSELDSEMYDDVRDKATEFLNKVNEHINDRERICIRC